MRLLPAICLAFLLTGPAWAQEARPQEAGTQDPPTFRLLLKDGRFDPARLEVPANARFVLVVRNGEDEMAEFESEALGVERIISAGREATLRLGPLPPGEYAFMDEFQSATAQGVLAARAP